MIVERDLFQGTFRKLNLKEVVKGGKWLLSRAKDTAILYDFTRF